MDMQADPVKFIYVKPSTPLSLRAHQRGKTALTFAQLPSEAPEDIYNSAAFLIFCM